MNERSTTSKRLIWLACVLIVLGLVSVSLPYFGWLDVEACYTLGALMIGLGVYCGKATVWMG